MRAATSILVSAGLVISLAACSPGPSSSDCTPVATGSHSNAVKAEGKFGERPKIEIATPTSAKTTERTVLVQGKGETVMEGDEVNIEYTVLSGKSGDELAASAYAETPVVVVVDQSGLPPGLVKTLECSTAGSRVVGVVPAIDAFGETGSEQLGIAAGEDMVFVADIISIVPPAVPPLPRADGADQEPTPGFPAVTLDADGRPTVTIPAESPSNELKIAVLKKGDGAVVADGADIVVHYLGINWNTGKIFDESWARGEPSAFNTGQVIKGFTAALVGQTVGSQVIVIIPPDYGYGTAGTPNGDIGGTDTIVFVVDILGIA